MEEVKSLKRSLTPVKMGLWAVLLSQLQKGRRDGGWGRREGHNALYRLVLQ